MVIAVAAERCVEAGQSLSGTHWSEVISGSEWGNGFLSLFIFGFVTSQLKLLQLRTASQSSLFYLFRSFPLLDEGAVLWPNQSWRASHFPVVFVVYALLVFFVCHHVIVFVE